MPRVLIIGGTGFVGSHVVRACLEASHDVFVGQGTHRPGLLDDLHSRLRRVPANLLHWPALLKGLKQSQPDVVVCCARYGIGDAGLVASAEAAPSRAVELHVGGFLNLLEAMRLLEVPRVIWTSSSTVYSVAVDDQAPVDEESQARPTSIYGVTKLMAELLARQYRQAFGVEIVGLRLPLVYGPGRWYVGQARALNALFTAAAVKRVVVIYAPAEPLDLMYAPDAGALVVACVAAPHLLHDRHNALSHRSSIAELAQIFQAVHPELELTVRPEATAGLPPSMSTARLERDLGFRPRYDACRACADYPAYLRASGAVDDRGAVA